MNKEKLSALLTSVAQKEIDISEAIEKLKYLPYEDLEFATIDHHRALRQGLPEVIFCPGKTVSQIIEIANSLLKNSTCVLATRVSDEQFKQFNSLQEQQKEKEKEKHSSFSNLKKAQFKLFPESRALVWGEFFPLQKELGTVSLVTAGTADLPIAHEAKLVLEAAGIQVDLISDIGVAGLHRLLNKLSLLSKAKVCIVVAGMDGALPSVIAGLLACPVIACPSSIGYGASFNGIAALLSMLNSCAAGLTVVNIDNGFGAAMAAYRILASA